MLTFYSSFLSNKKIYFFSSKRMSYGSFWRFKSNTIMVKVLLYFYERVKKCRFLTAYSIQERFVSLLWNNGGQPKLARFQCSLISKKRKSRKNVVFEGCTTLNPCAFGATNYSSSKKYCMCEIYHLPEGTKNAWELNVFIEMIE